MRWPETGCVGQKFAGEVRGCIQGSQGLPHIRDSSTKFRNHKSVIRSLNQKGLPQKSGIWPDVQSAGVLLRSHKIQDSHSSHRMEEEIRRYMLDEGWIHGEQ